jgi:Fe-S cluster biogenesis protein NfuA
MQMGIERILREKFPSLVEVIKVEDTDTAPKELSDYEAMVEVELQRIRPAITAMGGNIRLISVQQETGMVQIQFRGSKKVQQGVELAILDIDFVKEVEFVEEE